VSERPRSRARASAGIALVRIAGGRPELLLVHPGGPFWRNKDEHAWSIPKGELDVPEPTPADLEATARREFTEETGHPVPAGDLVPLPEVNLGSGKRLHPFALAGEIDPALVVSNSFELEWPPRSGRMQSFPEVDRAAWFGFVEARTKLHKGQVPLIDRLEAILAPDRGGADCATSELLAPTLESDS
jgi:predicted NUDIX family NTP pyrophosphohydrolase